MMVFLKLSDFTRWLGFSVFELWMHTIGLLFFTVILTIKVEFATTALSWWGVFSPLFAACALQAYFNLIVLVRHSVEETSIRNSFRRALVSCISITVISTFEVILCSSLEGLGRGSSVVLVPVFLLMAMLLVRACASMHQ